MQFTVGGSAINVTSLGRIYLSGNKLAHSVKLVNAATGVDVPGGTVQLTMVAGTANSYQYATLPVPVQLMPGTAYFLLSQELSGGDTWYDISPVTSTLSATINGPVYQEPLGRYVLVPEPPPVSRSYVPLNFQYSVAVGPPPTVSISQPTANSVLSGSVKITASASAGSGFSIASVIFKLNGSVPIGAAVTTAPYQVALDTTAFTDGTYAFSATAIDTDGNVTSTSVPVTLANGNVLVGGTPFVRSATFGAIRNNYSGFVGMQFSVGAQPLTINSLGRIFVAGNTGIHTVKLVNSSTGQDVQGGSAQVAMAGGTARQFNYSPLPSPLTLPAGASYYLVSQETSGGDQWYDDGPLTFTSVATLPGGIYYSGFNYVLVSSAPGNGYVPLSFLYGATSAHAAPTVTVTSPSGGNVSGTVTFSATASSAASLQITSLQLLLDAAAFGTADTAPSQTAAVSLSLPTSSLSSGGHTLSAIAIDSSGQSTTSAGISIVVNNNAGVAPGNPGAAPTNPIVVVGNPSAPVGSALITNQGLNGSLRSDFSGAVGMELQVGNSPMTVSQVGRFCAPGDSMTHIVKLVQSNGADVAGGSASVSMAGCLAGTYSFATLSTQITLQSNTSYFLVSFEAAGGDQWYDRGAVIPTSAATIAGPVYLSEIGYVVVAAANTGYVPVNLLYQLAITLPPTVSIASPAASATVSGTLTITANAVAASGISISSVQFQQNGKNIGAAIASSGTVFSSQIDTTTLANGLYSFTAIATDSLGNSSTSAPVVVTVSNSVAPVGQPFITQQSPGGPRNDFAGYVGMQFTVGAAPLTVTQLGRICVAGNAGTHVVKLVNVNGSDVTGGSVNLTMQGCATGAYLYGPLTSALVLAANTSYYLISLEASGGDQWYDVGTVTAQSQGTVNGPVVVQVSSFNLMTGLAGSAFVPLNFIFSPGATATAAITNPVVGITSPAPQSVVAGTITITATATAAPGLTIASVQFQRTGTNIGPIVTGAGPTFSVQLDTKTLLDGAYNFSVVAKDSAGNSTFSSSNVVTIANNLTAPTVSVTTPKAGLSAAGMLSVSAAAVPATGTTIASLQLLVDGQSFGAPCAAVSCSAVLDTTVLPNGSHRLAAIATDSDEGHATSPTVPFQTNNPVVGIGLLNGFMPGLPRTYGDWIGMQFTTGCTAISVTALGRIYVPGNTGTHSVKLVLASNATDVPGGSATISFTGAVANRITYAPLAAPIILPANTAYYLVSQEATGGDQFYDYEPILTMGAVTVNGPAYLELGEWVTPAIPNYIYVPVDLKFTVPGVPFPTPIIPSGGSPSASQVAAITPAANNHVLVTGQSLATGATGSPALSTTQPYSNQMLSSNGLAFVPLTEAGVGGNVESVDSALGNAATFLSPAFSDVVTNAGLGGASYAELAKGTVAYANGIAQFNEAKNLSATAGKTYKISGVAIIHGESDEDLGTTAAAYEADLVQWQNAYQTDAIAISGQSDSVPFFIDQENSWTYSKLAAPLVALGQLSAAEDNPTSIFLIGPKYQYHYNDGVHMDDFSYREEGEQFGKAIKQALVDGKYPKPFAPKSVTRSGNLVTVVFNVPAPPLQFDTYTVLPKSAMGFEYSDGSACSPFIVSAQITAGDTVTLTLSSAPAGTNEHVRYAITGIPGSFAGRDQPGAAHGNLKDSDPGVSLYGNDLSNWAVAFDKIVIAQ